ncbi:bifunctional UDP-N-acetylglucosamine diphosphorylase/glucosamine-1-phosphate N-acetyltransferase GlmU [Anaeromyxobacter diazotrophicus]|uniref:Bifunctional protein GlmU n=1 Tax=Anaeromyxobacter diazotrophicus TaxID=2590199 RepID=A0A7I9VHS5_9BACT|nr:bifunctional UDP-N-acetylglucosamine diphosphorylase/glucosamine-1-phosphate N-acetyltransferase GlmU [Anaeromyxobacter diazotrophicus]GEJ55789.1 bifunctional protein GlmU [Anaeromyxobacter diazotrophicus]
MATPRRRTPVAAIVLAAGKGTRMKTRRAKVLHEVCGRPLVYYPVKRALEAGADPVVVVVGHQAEEVEAALRAHLPGAPLRFAVQKEQLGTAHAVLSARPSLRGFDGEVLILSGDTPLLTTETLRAVLRRRGRAALAFATMTLENPTGYGRVVHAPHGGPALVVEEKDATDQERLIREVNAGLYCAEAAFLWKTLSRVGSKNAQREFYLTDLVALAAEGPGAVAARVPPFEAAGVNDQEELSLAARALTRRLAERLMRAGVTLEDPERFDCDEGVEVGPDTVLEPSVRLRGATRVGAGCRVGQGSILTDTTVADGAVVKPYCVFEQAVVGPAALVGPFSRLRPGADVGAGAHVGNFVELKKTRLGAGAKANHLTYLGDATIGAGTNVGCGTVTCNYDGEKKHPTTIGERAFIGSDAILVAPITIGDGAYVAAGSTLTEDVPAGALALGRSRQVNKEGWVAAHQAAQPAAPAARRAGARRPRRAAG